MNMGPCEYVSRCCTMIIDVKNVGSYIIFSSFCPKVLQTLNFQKLNMDGIKYLDEEQVSSICVQLSKLLGLRCLFLIVYRVSTH